MDEVEITWFRALKIWWSFGWRSWLLTMAIAIPLQLALFVFLLPTLPVPTIPAAQPPIVQHLQPPNIKQVKNAFLVMALMWPVFMAAVIAAQAQGMRWMLKKARWSDFAIKLVKTP